MANEIYSLVVQWPRIAQDTVGRQLIRSVDSIAANLVEGDARGSDPDSIRFFRYARSSARETCHWIRQALARGLIEGSNAYDLVIQVEGCGKMISGLINYRQKGPNNLFVREELSGYGLSSDLPTPQ